MTDFPDRPFPQRIRGLLHYPGWLSPGEQRALAEEVRQIAARAPLFSPMTPSGKAMSVRMTSAGRFGWTADRKGYRYAPAHPSGAPWPAIPESILAIWRAVVPEARPPESCLVNFYGPGARMGLHQDRDERDVSQPVVSISLGDDALFRIGSETRGGPSQSLWLRSGDVLVMGGEARLLHHGIDRIEPGSSMLLRGPGRINLTLRVVS